MISVRRAVCLSSISLLSASCAMTLPVRGQVQNTAETFSGTATGHLNGGGNLQMVSSQGAVCNGNFVYVTHRQGEGVFNCNDGRSGPFAFVSTGTSGTGHGTLNSAPFIFVFGNQ
jgi:hypothetical protein